MTSVQNNNWQESLVGNTDLYRAQDAAIKAIDTYYFSKYTEAYIESFEGTARNVLWIYNRTYTIVSNLLNRICVTVQIIAVQIFNAQDYFIGRVTRPLGAWGYRIYEEICPRNEINGRRHYVISREREKIIGDWFFYPLHTWGFRRTYARIDGNHTIEQKVNEVVENIKQHNRHLLRCEIEGERPAPGEVRFNYRAMTVDSNQINAFAVPGGGMVVFSRIVRELRDSIGAITETTITLADGSTVKIDLSGVTLEDVLAALLGHEMTHVASRHSYAVMGIEVLISVILTLCRVLIMTCLVFTFRSAAEKQEIIEDSLAGIQKVIENITVLFHIRRNEYEADTTGAYFARRSGYNPLGALYLQEFFRSINQGLAGELMDLQHRYLEFMYTHPWGENRKRALLASIEQFAPETLENGVMHTFIPSTIGYDYDNSSTAVQYGRHLAQRIAANATA